MERREKISKIDGKTVLVTGYAKTPQGMVMQRLYSFIGVILEIDPKTDKVIDAEFTIAMKVAQRFFKNLIVGCDLKELDLPLMEVCARHMAPFREAMVNAIQTAAQRY